MRGDRYDTSTPAPLTKILVWAAGLILIILLARFIGGGGGESLDSATVSLKLTDTTSSAEITDTDSDTKTVSTNTPLAPLDLIEVKNGTGQVLFLDNARNSLNLNTGTKIRYTGQNSEGKTQFRLENKDLWIQSDTASMIIDLIGVTLTPSSTTVMNISKNELFTTITVLQGSASILVGSETEEITAGKQLNYSTLRALTIEDIRSRVTPVNPETLTSEWMSLNGASSFGAGTSGTTTTTPGVVNVPSSVSGGLVLFESPIDESTVESKTITITGRILSASVSRVTVNNTPATVDPVKQTFTLNNVSLGSKENNLVYRTYDVNGALLSKGLVTVYTTTPGSGGTATAGGGAATVETYKVDNRFKVVAPASDFYETRETKVKIEGTVAAKAAHHITINGYKLNSFAPNGTSWYYFANQQFGTLDEGVNLYNIQYFDAQDVEIFKQLFVIKKLPPFSSTKTPATTVTPKPTTQTNTSTGGQKEIIPTSSLSDG